MRTAPLLALAGLVASCAAQPRMKLVSPPDVFPVVRGDVSLGKPALEADEVALTIRVPVENRGAAPLDASTVVAVLTDSKARVHPLTVRGTIDPTSTGELVLFLEPDGVARGLADLVLTIPGGAPISLDIEIGRSEAANERVRRWGLTAAGVAVLIGLLVLIGIASSEDDCEPGTLPGQCNDPGKN